MDGLALGAAGLAMSSPARSYAQIMGANDRVTFATIGLNGRAYAHLSSLKANEKTSRLAHVADVESTILNKFCGNATKELGYAPKTHGDFRKMLELKEIDAISIASPDHWHTPMAVAGLQAGKHVYVEKPCSYDPHEVSFWWRRRRSTPRSCRWGASRGRRRTRSRSSEDSWRADWTSLLREGLVCEQRKSIGVGKVVPVPSTLDWDLWQGPAPRQAYKDNVQPYNWHWFKVWGTGESLNNGTHEVDVCRWALGVDFPKTVSAQAGRYQFKDDWQFYDTMVTDFNYEDKMITWEGRCCNPMKLYDRDRGSIIQGTNGSVIIDRDGYEVYDQSGKHKIDEFKVSTAKTSSTDTTGKDSMTDLHFANFIAAIQKGEKLNQPIASGNVAVTMLQLSNVAWETNRVLTLDQTNGHIVNDPKAQAMTHREYEKGWELKI